MRAGNRENRMRRIDRTMRAPSAITLHQRELLRALRHHPSRLKEVRPRRQGPGCRRWMRPHPPPPHPGRGWGAGVRMICTRGRRACSRLRPGAARTSRRTPPSPRDPCTTSTGAQHLAPRSTRRRTTTTTTEP